MVTSAAMLMYRVHDELEVLLVHPGGPLWKNKDKGAWSIPKGEVETGELLLDAAQREFTEETSLIAEPPYIELGHVTQGGGKVVHAWAFRSAANVTSVSGIRQTIATRSNTFEMEWPPRSGRMGTFLEIDCAEFFRIGDAMLKINVAQAELLMRLVAALDSA